MKRVAMLATLCCGAAAQRESVEINGVTLPDSWAANNAVDKPFGADGTVYIVPSWLAQPEALYTHVPEFGAGDRLTFVPENGGAAPGRSASALTHSGQAPEKACGMGWAKLEHPDGENTCFTEINGLPPNNWGWSNRIQAGQDFHHTTIPVYIGAAKCQGGHHRFDIAAKYDNEANTITVDLTPVEGYSLRAAHVYVGKELLPRSKNGAFTDSPGSFPKFVNVGDDPRVVFETDGSGDDYYFAVHVNVCPAKEPEPEPTAPPTCPSTFWVNYYICSDASCSAEAATGNIAANLVDAGWTSMKEIGLCFKTPASDWIQITGIVTKELSAAEDAPPSDGPVSYIGVISTGCGDTLTPPVVPPPSHLNPGPAKSSCGEWCLAPGGMTGPQ